MDLEREKRDIEKLKKKWPGADIASVNYDKTGKVKSFLYQGELYNPAEYWHAKGIDYQPSGEMDEGYAESEAPEVENLKNLVAQYELLLTGSALEIGSGYGRIYNKLKGMTELKISMCDFVQSMRYNCLRKTGILPEHWDGNELPYNDSEFDLVISFSVLLHVKPDKIDQVLKEHARVCKRYLFIATHFGGIENLAPHCFEHDYKDMFDYLCLKIEDEKFFRDKTRVNWLLSK